MPYNPRSLQNLRPTKPGEIRNPSGKNFNYGTAINAFLEDMDPDLGRIEKKTRFAKILEKAYEHATEAGPEFAFKYQEMFFKFAVEHPSKETELRIKGMELRLKALALLDPGIKDGKYTLEETAQRLALVEGTATDAEAETVSSEPASEEPDGKSD